MIARAMQTGEDIPPGEGWVTTTKGMSGFFAVHMWMNNEDPESVFGEPWDTGLGRYATEQEAQDEAYELAVALDLPYNLPGYVPPFRR